MTRENPVSRLMETLFSIGVDPDRFSGYINDKIRICNQIALFLSFLGLVYLLVSLAYFPILGLLPGTSVMVGLLTLALNHSGRHRISRFFMGTVPLFMDFLYHAFLVKKGDPMITPLYLAAMSFALYPWVLADIREKCLLIPSAAVCTLCIVLQVPANGLIEMAVDDAVFRGPVLTAVTYGFAVLIAVTCLTFMQKRNLETEYERDRLLDKIRSKLSREHSSRRKSEKRQQELEQQLVESQKREAIGRLAGGIAHDFNNILSGLFAFTQLAKSHMSRPDRLAEDLDQISRGTERAAELVRQILTFSRQSVEEMRPLEIIHLLKEALKLLRATIPATIDIQSDLQSSAFIKAAPAQIHQVVMNLCTNAYQAMDDTGGVLSVSLVETRIEDPDTAPVVRMGKGNYLTLEVADTGCGIASDIRSRIFDPYFTTKEVGKGTGLGLAVVAGIIKKQNGYIHLDSSPGKGTTVRVFWPVIDPPRSQRPSGTGDMPAAGESGTIMLVDDEATLIESLTEILEQRGYIVHAYHDGLHALEAFEKDPGDIDLIVTDMTMPMMTGDVLAVEALKIRPDIPVILCSGYTPNLSEKRARRIGIRKHLQKPVRPQDLLASVRQTLAEKEAPPKEV